MENRRTTGYNAVIIGEDMKEINRLKVEDVILVIIDVQEKLFNVVEDKLSILSTIIKLVKGVQILGCPCILTEQYPMGLGKTVKELKKL